MRVLSIDGGGIRGIIPALVLAEIERRTARPAFTLFDFIAGTSTGGIVACALARPDPADPGRPAFTADEVAALYEDEGPVIFSRSLLKRITSVEGFLDERYDDAGLNATLERYLGTTRLREALTPLFITAYDIERRKALFFRSTAAVADPASDFSMVEATRATSGAPSYFEPVRVTDAAGAATYTLVDGGVFAINPAMCAYAELADGHDRMDVFASLGTGAHTRPLPYDDVRGWGQLEWARPILDVVVDGVADTVDFQLSRLLAAGRYVRLQTQLTLGSDEFDDASAANLANLRREAERLIADRSEDIDRLCARLTA